MKNEKQKKGIGVFIKSNIFGILALILVMAQGGYAAATYVFTDNMINKEDYQKIYQYVYENGGEEKETCLKPKTWHAASTQRQICAREGGRWETGRSKGRGGSYADCVIPGKLPSAILVDKRCR